MKKLFDIGFNSVGFYVFPLNAPPHDQQPTGDEVTLDQALTLCDSLNASVDTYITQVARDDVNHLLCAINKHWTWRAVLYLIADLLWKDAWAKRDESYSVFRRRNAWDISRVARDWA